MEANHDPISMFELLTQPAFLVKEGRIIKVNPGAASYLLAPEQDFSKMLLTGKEEYTQFTTGRLYVTLKLGEFTLDACVIRMKDFDVVTLDSSRTQESLQVLSMASTAIREIMNGLMSTADHFLLAAAKNNEQMQNEASLINKRLHQLLRIVGNMSDAGAFALPGRMEPIEICGFFQELLQKFMSLDANSAMRLRYDLPKEAIYTLANPDKLERAVLNQLSNAIKHSVPGSDVNFRLFRKNQRVYISVSNTPVDPEVCNRMHNQFLRTPGLEDPRCGIGLGMLLMQNAAAAHGGALLTEMAEGILRVTMSLKIQQRNYQVRSPIMGMDQHGGHDPLLIELSDFLPPEAYRPEN